MLEKYVGNEGGVWENYWRKQCWKRRYNYFVSGFFCVLNKEKL